jgi:hypothetical protein
MSQPTATEVKIARKRQFVVHADFPEEDVMKIITELENEGFMGRLSIDFARGGHINAMSAEDATKIG